MVSICETQVNLRLESFCRAELEMLKRENLNRTRAKISEVGAIIFDVLVSKLAQIGRWENVRNR